MPLPECLKIYYEYQEGKKVDNFELVLVLIPRDYC